LNLLRLSRGGVVFPEADIEIAKFEDVGISAREDETKQIAGFIVILGSTRILESAPDADAALDQRDPVQARFEGIKILLLIYATSNEGGEFATIKTIGYRSDIRHSTYILENGRRVLRLPLLL